MNTKMSLIFLFLMTPTPPRHSRVEGDSPDPLLMLILCKWRYISHFVYSLYCSAFSFIVLDLGSWFESYNFLKVTYYLLIARKSTFTPGGVRSVRIQFFWYVPGLPCHKNGQNDWENVEASGYRNLDIKSASPISNTTIVVYFFPH